MVTRGPDGSWLVTNATGPSQRPLPGLNECSVLRGSCEKRTRRWNGGTSLGLDDRLRTPELGRLRYCTIRNLNMVNSLNVGPGCGAQYLSRRLFDCAASVRDSKRCSSYRGPQTR